MMRYIVTVCVLLLMVCSQAAGAPSAGSLLCQGFRLSATSAGEGNAGKENPVLLACTFVPPPGIYFYGPEVKSGLPTKATVLYAPVTPFADTPEPGTARYQKLLGAGGTPLAVRMPAPTPKKDTSFASLQLPGVNDADTPIFADPITIWAEIPSLMPYYTAAAIKANVSGLLCSASSCLPFTESAEFLLQASMIAAFPAADAQAWRPAYNRGEAPVLSVPPLPDHTVGAAYLGGRLTDDGIGADTGKKPGTRDGGLKLGNAPVSLPSSAGAGPAGAAGTAVITGKDYAAVFASFSPIPSNPEVEVQDLGEALFFGLIAGLLLNLMPCVLPVVSLKFTALMAVSAMEDKHERARAFRRHCLIFAAGIMTWFIMLAALLGGAGWAWGELFQSPHVIVTLGLILFLLGLSMFGVYTLPIFDLRVANDRHPHMQSFGGGLLATLLATPCSGPLLGGVLGWALRQPPAVSALCVICVGVGMALPYGVFALRPELVHLLPRPGNWTMRLEQLLGFFLMGSVIYLATLLPAPWVPAFLFILLAIAVAAWLWGQIGHLGASRFRRNASRLTAVSLVAFALWWGHVSLGEDFFWEEFQPDVFVRDLGREPMLLEFTADWCPSCKALEYTTLNKSRMTRLRDQYKMRTIQVDITREDPVAKALLRSLDSVGIPVIALFPAGENAKKPLVLRDLVTPAQLEQGLARTFY